MPIQSESLFQKKMLKNTGKVIYSTILLSDDRFIHNKGKYRFEQKCV
jgi:hypothetical protein